MTSQPKPKIQDVLRAAARKHLRRPDEDRSTPGFYTRTFFSCSAVELACPRGFHDAEDYLAEAFKECGLNIGLAPERLLAKLNLTHAERQNARFMWLELLAIEVEEEVEEENMKPSIKVESTPSLQDRLAYEVLDIQKDGLTFVITAQTYSGVRLDALLSESEGVWHLRESCMDAWHKSIGKRKSWIKALADSLDEVQLELKKRSA